MLFDESIIVSLWLFFIMRFILLPNLLLHYAKCKLFPSCIMISRKIFIFPSLGCCHSCCSHYALWSQEKIFIFPSPGCCLSCPDGSIMVIVSFFHHALWSQEKNLYFSMPRVLSELSVIGPLLLLFHYVFNLLKGCCHICF